MARDRDQWADDLTAGNSGGWLTGFLADEDELDRRALWRLGSWGVGSIAAVIVALLANHYAVGLRREQVAAADLARQSQQIQLVARESQNETRRLASAIDTLNSDRDRLYSRVTVLEQGLDTVTGAIARQNAATTSPASSPSASTSSAAQPAEVPTVLPSLPPPAIVAPATTAAVITDRATNVAALAPDTPAPSAVAPAPSAPTNKASGAAIQAPKTTAAAATATAASATATATAAPPTATAAPTTANAAPATATAAPATATAAPATATAAPATPTPLMPAKSIMAPPDPAAAKLAEPDPSGNTAPASPSPQTVASTAAATESDPAPAQTPPSITVQRTEFGIDLGGANSIDGLRALWRGLLKYRANKALADLRPIIVVRERASGLGMQLRLVAGPLSDAAAAAKLCATLTENDRSCETTVFDGQRLAMKSDNSAPAPAAVPNSPPAPTSTRSSRKRGSSRGARLEQPAPAARPEPPRSTLTSILGLR